MVKPEDVSEIVEKTFKNNEVIDRLLYKKPTTGESCKGDKDIPFYTLQKRTVLKNCRIEPDDITEYIHTGGYSGAEKAIKEMEPMDVCNEVLASGMRGRVVGGFPTGLKWKFTLPNKSDKKYVICNGDEGDPGIHGPFSP